MLTIHTRRIILAMMMPGLCLALAMLFNNEVYHFVVPIYASLPYLVYMLLLAGLILAWGYNNGREFNLLLNLGIAYWSIRQFVWSDSLPEQQQSILVALLCIVVPITFLLHAVLPERGVWRWQIAKRLGIAAILIAVVTLAVYFNNQLINNLLWTTIWQQPRTITIPTIGIIAFMITAFGLSMQLYLQTNVLRVGIYMGLLASFIALNNLANPSMAMIYFSIAAAAILIAVVLNSYNLTFLDELTNLPSRRALKQQLMAVGKRYSIAMLDIDHFKNFNDSYGHDIGDQALRKVAEHLRKIQGGGKVYRYGGEEFTIVFHNKDAREALIYVDALREAIAADPFYIRSRQRPRTKPEKPSKTDKTELRKVKLTISAGIAQRADQHANPMDVIKSADKALYCAKRAGRNRVHAI